MSRREKLEKMLLGQPDDTFLHYAMAMEWLKEGKPDLALERLDRVLALDPGYLGAYFQKANTLAGEGRLGEARETLEVGIATARQKSDGHAADEMQALMDSLS